MDVSSLVEISGVGRRAGSEDEDATSMVEHVGLSLTLGISTGTRGTILGVTVGEDGAELTDFSKRANFFSND